MDTQSSLFDADSPASAGIHNILPNNNQDTFGCCSRYRDCSAVHRCIIPDMDYSTQCFYRQNLEAGKTFFGKHADSFSMSRYTELQHRTNMLSSTAKEVLNSILIDLLEFNRGALRTLIRKDCVSDLQKLDLFDFQSLQSAFPELCSYQVLKPIISDHPHYGSLFRQSQMARAAELAPLRNAKKAAKLQGNKSEFSRLDKELKKLSKNGKPSENTKDFLIQWMNSEGVSLRDELADPYRFARIRPSENRYIEELYQDTLLSSYDKRIYVLSPLTTDGWRTFYDWEEDELRRIKLSHGYSAEEKLRMVTAIQETRAACAGKYKEAKDIRLQKESGLE